MSTENIEEAEEFDIPDMPIVTGFQTPELTDAQLHNIIDWLICTKPMLGKSLDSLIKAKIADCKLEYSRKLKEAQLERDAAREDLRRIGNIVSNPLMIVSGDEE